MTDYLREAAEIEKQVIDWRRDFHKNPELSLQEYRTAGIVAEVLRGLGMEVREKVGKTGVVGLLKGAHPGPCVLLRFDMDALPMQEFSEHEYSSVVPNVMHACGHDTHVSMGLGSAMLLAKHRDELHGSVKFMFQPAEENGSGAELMIQDGLLESPVPDKCFGIHIHSQTPSGKIGITDGPVLSSASTFQLKVIGKGGHGAEPQDSIDPIVTAAHIITLIQTIVSRNVEPFEPVSISVGAIHAGSAYNIIPEIVEMRGSIRTYTKETAELVFKRMRTIVENAAAAMGCKVELELSSILPATVNDPATAAVVRQICSDLLGPDWVDANNRGTASEDFSLVLDRVPGVYLVLGAARKENDYPHHNPYFDINESMMKNGVALMSAVAAHYLSADSTE